jgi:probable HAF family extracellular repeat protein
MTQFNRRQMRFSPVRGFGLPSAPSPRPGIAVALVMGAIIGTTASSALADGQLLDSTQLQITYQLTDLGSLGGGSSFATAINSSGQIAGYSSTKSGNNHAFLYSGGTMLDLGSLGGIESRGLGINDSGQVVGYAAVGTEPTLQLHPFLYSGGKMIDLKLLPGTNPEQASANAINNKGQVVGDSRHAFLYNNGAFTDLGTLQGKIATVISSATGINDAGQITGYSYDGTRGVGTVINAFLDIGGTMTDLGSFGGNLSFARAINNAGQVVGTSNLVGNIATYRGFIYSGGTMTDLGTLGGDQSFPEALNDNGDVVGYSYIDANTPRAFVYSHGAMMNLNDLIDPSLGWTLEDAHAINELGQIAGWGVTPSGAEHAFLLTQVPEPTISQLMMAAAAFILQRSRRAMTRSVVGSHNLLNSSLPHETTAFGRGTLEGSAVPALCREYPRIGSPSREGPVARRTLCMTGTHSPMYGGSANTTW